VRKACKVTALALMVCLPPLVWWLGIASPWIAVLLLAVGVLHFAGADSGFARLQGALAVAVGVVIGAGGHRLALYYPVIVNAAFLLLWFHTWLYPPSIIERMVRRRESIDAAKSLYLRRLTLAWCGIFALNGSIALVTTQFDDLTAWVLWNGLGAYLLVGAFALGEYLFRRLTGRAARPGAAA